MWLEMHPNGYRENRFTFMQDLGSVKTFFQREPVTQFRNTNMVSTATFNWNKICKEGSGIPLNPGDLR